MNLSEPSPDLLEAAGRSPCTLCDVARASWADGGYHLSCRACEIRAVDYEPIAARQAFYSRLVALAEAGAPACGDSRGGRAA